jgi:hypothetical protein
MANKILEVKLTEVKAVKNKLAELTARAERAEEALAEARDGHRYAREVITDQLHAAQDAIERARAEHIERDGVCICCGATAPCPTLRALASSQKPRRAEPTIPNEGRAYPLAALLAAVDNALSHGSYVNNGNLAFEYLCDHLGVDRESLIFDREWSRRPAALDGGQPDTPNLEPPGATFKETPAEPS